MTHINKCDTVSMEPRKILEIEKYGLTMTTHLLWFDKGVLGWETKKSRGRPAELVAFLVEKEKRFFERPLCQVGLISQEDMFLVYKLSERIKIILSENKMPFTVRDEIDNTDIEAYFLTDMIPKAEGVALVETLNDGFRKARNLFEEKLKEKADEQAKALRERMA